MMCWLTCLRPIKETERSVWVLIRFETAAAFEKKQGKKAGIVLLHSAPK